MTFAEIQRAIDSYQRVKKTEEQEKATLDYILADLIGRSVSRLFSSQNKYPAIYDAYPSLFDSQQIKQKEKEKATELSALRFKQFAQMHNKKFKKEADK